MGRCIRVEAVLALWIGLAACAVHAEEGRTVLHETCCWRRYYRFGRLRISAAVLKAEGRQVLKPNLFARLQRDVQRALRERGVNLAKVDWRDHAAIEMRGARALAIFPTPPPPRDWAAPDFDDRSWVRDRAPFQGGPKAKLTRIMLGQYEESVDLRLRSACYRARFVVDDARAVGSLSVSLEYTGGARVLVNGHEIVRGHLPEGELAPDTAGADYPAEAYGPNGERLCRRRIRSVAIPAQHVRKGVNVVAVEIRGSHLHPIVMRNKIQPNWGGPMRPWPHARLFSVQLHAASDGVRRCIRRPAGVQVYVEDAHHRTLSTDFLPPGEEAGTIRFVGARNGTYGAQVVVGTDKPLKGLSARPSDLKQAGGGGHIPASAIRTAWFAPFPTSRWSLEHLGDERGLGATFPTNPQLAGYARMKDKDERHLFDWLRPKPPASVPAGTACPLWLSLTVPANAAPGQYRGTLEVAAGGMKAASLPLELEVIDWRVPDPRDFKTFVACEQNPYAVARQYGVELWSAKHLRLLEPSFRQLARIGSKWLNVPVLVRTEFGNVNDSMIRWVRKRDGSLAFDTSVLDRYLDLAVRHLGTPRCIQFVVMQGMKSPTVPPTPPKVMVHDEATGKAALYSIGRNEAQPRPRNQPGWKPPEPVGEKPVGKLPPSAWRQFATAIYAHMKARGLEKAMYWGAPLETEADPSLKTLLAAATPDVHWTAYGHEIMYNAKYCQNTRFYRIITDIRYQWGWNKFRTDEGWRSPITHLASPRVGGTSFALHTTSLPFAYRLMVDRALAMGRTGFGRVGADEWAGVHFDGMDIARWLTGVPVLFVLWPGEQGAEPSARFEMLLEGIQETEARIFVEQALHRGGVPQPLARRARKVLKAHFDETNFVQGNSIVHSMEAYPYGWQARSRRLYGIAAEAARALAP